MSRPIRLYDLLPRYVRFRDQRTEGKALENLIDALQVPFDELRANIDMLFDAWFVETCEPWLVPYVGDLLAMRGLDDPQHNVWSQRAQVANTLAYRRRRGTLAVIEGASRNATGWPAQAWDGADFLTWTQHLDDPRPDAVGVVDLRQLENVEDLLLAPAVPRLVDTSGRQGPFTPGEMAVRLWHHDASPIRRARAQDVSDGQGLRYTIDPFGVAVPLYQNPRTPSGTVFRHRLRHLPLPIDRGYARERLLYAQRSLRRESLEELLSLRVEVFVGPPSLVGGRVLRTEDIWITDLSNWHVPEPDRWPSSEGRDRHGKVQRPRVALDPSLGYLAFRDPLPGRVLWIDACRAIDGGPGSPGGHGGVHALDPTRTRRQRNRDVSEDGPPAFVAKVHRGADPGLPETLLSLRDPTAHCAERAEMLILYLLALTASSGRPEDPAFLPSLSEALTTWRRRRDLAAKHDLGPLRGMIQILDSGSYSIGTVPLELDGDTLVMRSASDARPFVDGRLQVQGPVPSAPEPGNGPRRQGRLRLGGLWIGGPVELDGAVDVELDGCVIRPPLDSVSCGPALTPIESGAEPFVIGSERFAVVGKVRATDTLLGPIHLDDSWSVHLERCLVDAGTQVGEIVPEAIGPSPVLEILTSTVLGSIRAKFIGARDSLFTGTITARDRSGRLDACYLPRGSQVGPWRGFQGPSVGSPPEPGDSPSPVFASRRYGDPDYGRLALGTESPLLTGTDDGGEIGAPHDLFRARRLRNLGPVFDEYVPWDRTPRIVHSRSTAGVWRRRPCPPPSGHEETS
ncbi:MAG: hypothetical protein AAGE94_01755 [Acidobacteriota bacterium]